MDIFKMCLALGPHPAPCQPIHLLATSWHTAKAIHHHNHPPPQRDLKLPPWPLLHGTRMGKTCLTLTSLLHAEVRFGI